MHRLRLTNELVARLGQKKRRWRQSLLDWQLAVEKPDRIRSEDHNKSCYTSYVSDEFLGRFPLTSVIVKLTPSMLILQSFHYNSFQHIIRHRTNGQSCF